MIKEEFLKKLEEIDDSDPDTLTGEDLLEDLPAWDSLAAVNLIALADEEFGLILSPKEIGECKIVNDLIALIYEPAS